MGNSQNKNTTRISSNAPPTRIQQTNSLIHSSNIKVETPDLPVKSIRTSGQLPNTSVKVSNTLIQSSNTSVKLSNTSVQSANTSVQSPNTSITSTIKPPRQFMTEEEFFQTWPSWKSDFLIYKKILSEEEPDNGKWGTKLLNIMGPNGLMIYSTFTFSSLEDKNDLNVLLNKFEEHYSFASKNKLPDEDTFTYIHHLQLTASKANIENAEQLIRNKILKEIDERTFTNLAKVQSPSFVFSTDFNNLTLKEIAFIWNSYDGNFKESCNRCGNNHGNYCCPALGKQCLRCNELNHAAKRCPRIYVNNCNYCGDAHFKKKCPAYNEVCTKCKKQHHFSWKCQSNRILQCRFCGYSHGASTLLCPARNNICIYCRTKGHFPPQCKSSYSNNR